ncbi:MAG: hypothetical protein QW320_08195 [Ignisphaera sp.]
MNTYIARPSTGFYAKHTYSDKRLYTSLDKASKKCVLIISEETVFPKVFSERDLMVFRWRQIRWYLHRV